MRLIDADAFFNDFPELKNYEHASQEYEVDAEPVKHGEWRTVTLPSYMFEGYRCSECAELVYGRTKYCPQCGAKMDEVKDI